MDKACIIHCFSAPAGTSLNDRADNMQLSFLGAMFRAMQRGWYLSKTHFSAFIRRIPQDPAQWELVTILWEGRLHVDACLYFGQQNAQETAFSLSMVVF